MIAGKVWGNTELVEANGALEFHRIEMNTGGVCSKHLHEFKWNGFYVESGRMLIRVWQNDYDLVDETILEAGMYTKVKPGVYHQFECLEEGVAFELYWAEFNHNDIKRETVGHAGDGGVETFEYNEGISEDLTIEESDVTFDFGQPSYTFDDSGVEVVPSGEETLNLTWDNVSVDGKL